MDFLDKLTRISKSYDILIIHSSLNNLRGLGPKPRYFLNLPQLISNTGILCGVPAFTFNQAKPIRYNTNVTEPSKEIGSLSSYQFCELQNPENPNLFLALTPIHSYISQGHSKYNIIKNKIGRAHV